MTADIHLADAALARLREVQATGSGGGHFTCDLSVDEFTLLHQAGYEPVGLVTGSSIYHIGFRWPLNLSKSQEVPQLSAAMYEARNAAMNRLLLEAREMGAEGVVGVRLTIDFDSWGEGLAEFIAIGTAIVKRDAARRPDWPWTSDLGGKDFWSLIRHGHVPCGLVMGACVWHVPYQRLGQWFGRLGQNVELENFTRAFYEARELAMERMQAEALRIHGEGVVGVQILERSHAWGSHTIEFLAIGTAIRSIAGHPGAPPPHLAVPLDA